MPHAFNRTLRALDSGHARASLALQVCALLALGAWFVWFFGARVFVLAHSDNARLEVAQTGHRVQSAISGYVTEVAVKLGQHVQQGDVLGRLDASGPAHKLEQRDTEAEALRAQIAAVRRELAAVSGVLDSEQRAGELRLQEADARHEQAAALAAVRDTERTRSEELLRAGVVPEAAALRTRSDADLQRREEQALALARRRLSADQQLARAERAQHLAQLATRATTLQGQLDALNVSLRELRAEVELCTLRAPIAGRVGDLAAWTRGAFVQPGDLLAVVVPEGNMRVVAQFPPDQALGRIRSGQRAQLRLTGFPFTQFGAVHGAVASVAKEAHEGTIRVELTLDHSLPHIPLQHALPGSLQVEIDHVSPATLAWRAVGRGLSTSTVSKQ
ncbi:MAG TPA: HlyD family efflux transporter periplasmic adaptor subunit [Polyangiales bacterium]|nr:HlyD family efflux transporter periplasmic adaptor subunit [Polyangiales bacterium]